MTIPDRRTVLRSGLAAAALGAVGAATGCTARPDPSPPTAASPARRHLIGPRSPQVAAAEAARHATGTVQAGVAPEAGRVDLGGPVVPTWSFGGQVPGPEIRVRAGQNLQALLVNRLPVETTVHWHGVAIRNDMDGVPGMTQAPVPAGQEFTYSFAVAKPGTYWYHPHVGVQLDRGLYGPLIVEDPAEPADYDHDWTVVLDDWIDGTGYTPDQVLDALRNGMGGMSMAAASPSPSPMMSSMGGMSGMPMPSSSAARPRRAAERAEPGAVRGAQRAARRRRRRRPLPVVPDQRPGPYRAPDLCRPPRPAGQDPLHQRRRRHQLPRRPGRSPDDRHPHRRLPGGPGAGRRAAHRDGGALRRAGHPRRRRVPADRAGRGEERHRAGAGPDRVRRSAAVPSGPPN